MAIDPLVNGTRELTATTDARGPIDSTTCPPAAPSSRIGCSTSASCAAPSLAAPRPLTADVALTLSLSADVVVTGARTFRNVADVENPAANLVGIAAAASQGAITAAQLERGR